MDRAERIGLGVAIAAHGALFLALSFGLLTRPDETDVRDAVSVTLTDEIGLESASPEPEAASAPRAPEDGPPEPMRSEPELTPAPRVEPTPPPPRPSARSERREPPPRSRPRSREEAAPRRPTERPAERRRGDRLSEITEGIGTNRSRSPSRAASAASVTGAQRSAYTALIISQIQPCVNRQSPPGPGADRIGTSLTLRFDADGSLAGRPRIRRQTGVDEGNARYSDRVGEQAVTSVMACSPIRGLPADLYRTDNGQGWHSVDVRITIEAQ